MNSSSEYETNFPFNLLVHVLEHNDVFGAYAIGAGIGPGLPHRSAAIGG